MSSPAKPNILFLFADDWGRYASAYGQLEADNALCQVVKTPNFDRLAAEGALFRHAFVPAPSCTPCRSSVLSGRYFWQTQRGAILLGAVWDDSIPSYPLILEQAGYHIGYSYKCWGPGTPANAPYGGDRTRYNEAGNVFNQFSHRATERCRERSVPDAKAELLDEIRQNFRDFLADRQGETPFCYWCGPTNTHRTWERGSGKALWDIDPDSLRGRLPGFLPDVPEIREDVADYLGECQAVDAALGVLRECLEEIGELDSTLIMVSGDHGIPGMPRGKCNLYDNGCEVALAARWPGQIPAGRVIDDMVNIMDLAPTFLEAAQVPVDPGMSADSLLPLLRSDQNGQVDAERTYVVTGRERHVACAREGYLPYPQRAIRTRRFLYIRNFEPERWPMGDPKGLDDLEVEPPPYEDLCLDTMICYADLDASPTKAWMIHHRAEDQVRPLYQLGFGKYPAEELYDVETDPDHLHNLIDSDEHQGIRQQLAAQLMAELERQEDPRLVEERCRFEHAPYTDPA